MKYRLSELIEMPEKRENAPLGSHMNDYINGYNQALSACDREVEIDEGAMAKIILEIVHTQRKSESAEECCRRASTAIAQSMKQIIKEVE